MISWVRVECECWPINSVNNKSTDLPKSPVKWGLELALPSWG